MPSEPKKTHRLARRRKRVSAGPTAFAPGTVEKVQVLMRRAEMELPLFDPRDAQGLDWLALLEKFATHAALRQTVNAAARERDYSSLRTTYDGDLGG